MVSFTKAFISTILIVGGSFFIPKLAGAGDSSVQAPFNVGEVIEKTSHYPRVEGDRIVIQDRTYEASFDRKGVVLRPWEKKEEGEDLFIPLSGEPAIRGGRVVYRQKGGEIVFEGRNSGLRFEQFSHSKVLPALGYTGNVAKLSWVKQTQNRKSGEFLIDTTVVYGSPVNDQFSPTVAFGGSNYLVAWEDFDHSTGNTDIHGARVTPSGNILDSGGIVISRAIYSQGQPVAAFDGANYFVAWNDGRRGFSSDIYGSRVTASGSVLDPNGIPICTDSSNQGTASIGFDGSNYFVVWMDERSGYYHIYGARVTKSGIVLDPNGILISPNTGSQYYPSIGFDGTNFFVVWRDSADIYGTRVDTSGHVIDSTGIAISTAPSRQDFPSVAFDGVNYLVVWLDGRGGSGYADIYGTRVSSSGIVLEPNGIAISTASNDQVYPSIAFDGSRYLVVWQDRRSSSPQIYGTRISTSGTVLDPNGILISIAGYGQYYPSVAFDGANFLVTWQDTRSANRDIYGARVDTAGVVLDPNGIALCMIANSQVYPSVASDGTDYLVVWQEWHPPYEGEDIYGARVSSTGRLLDTTRIVICEAPANQSRPFVAFDGTDYLVVWFFSGGGNYLDIYGARVSTSGEVLDPGGFPICTAPWEQYNPSVASDGTNSLAVWSDFRRGGTGTSDLYGARVSSSGVVLDTNGIGISVGGGYHFNPRVASNGKDYLAVWCNYTGEADIYGARVDSSGRVLGGFTISGAVNTQSYPSIAYDGNNYFVVWEDWRNDKSDIYGARVDTSGHVLDTTGIAISTKPTNKYSPSVAFDGLNYLVVWVDTSIASDCDIWGARVSPSGVVLDSFPVSTQTGNQESPVVTKGPANQLLIAYSGFTDSVITQPANTMRIWGKFYPLTGVEQEKGMSFSAGWPTLRVYPNPFREKAWVSANVPGRLKVYDALGRLVREFPKETAKPGPLVWDGRDEHGRRLPGGVYFLRYEHGTGCETRKAVLIR